MVSCLSVPQMELIVNKEFIYIPVFKNKAFLTQKYVTEGLSIQQISEQIGSSKEAVRSALIGFESPVREACQHHGRPSQPPYGQRVIQGRAVPFCRTTSC